LQGCTKRRNIKKNEQFAHRVYWRVLYGSYNKQKLFNLNRLN